MRRRTIGRAVTTLLAGGALTSGALLAGVGQAGASTFYGPGAVYQVEISANTSPVSKTAGNGNFWVWAALYTTTGSMTSNYQEADCVHVPGIISGASHDAGDGSWMLTTSAHELVLTTVEILGGLETATLSIPTPAEGKYGHTAGMNLTLTKTTATGHGPIPVGASITYPSQNQIAQ